MKIQKAFVLILGSIIVFVVLTICNNLFKQHQWSRSDLNVHYKITGKQDRLKDLLDTSVKDQLSWGYGFEIFVHKAGDIEGTYSSITIYGTPAASDNCYEHFSMGEFETKEGIMKCALCYRYYNDHYVIYLSPSEQFELYQKLYDIQFFNLSNLTRRWEYIDRTMGNYYPEVDIDLSKIDYVAIGSDLTIAVNNSTPENNVVIEEFYKFVKDKYHDRLLNEGEKVIMFPSWLD